MIITAAHVIRAMIPAMRDWRKKTATIHAARNETHPAASIVSFRILIEDRECNGDIRQLTFLLLEPVRKLSTLEF